MTAWDQVVELLGSPLMQRALLAAILVGAAAPVVGTFLVQRRMALLGDGIGHVALTGVALGWLVGSWAGLVPQDALALPGAVIAAVVGSIVIELVRERGRTSGDEALLGAEEPPRADDRAHRGPHQPDQAHLTQQLGVALP